MFTFPTAAMADMEAAPKVPQADVRSMICDQKGAEKTIAKAGVFAPRRRPGFWKAFAFAAAACAPIVVQA